MMSRKKLLMVGGATIVALLVIAGGIVLWQRAQTDKKYASARNQCVDDAVGKSISGKAELYFTPSGAKALKPIADKAKALPNYDKSATCLYIATMYDLNISDGITAKKDYDKLAVVYKSKNDLGENIRSAAKSLDELKALLSVNQKQIEQIKQNRSQYQMPTAEQEKEILGQ